MTSLSPSACSPREPRRAGALSSRARSFIAARSSSVNRAAVLSVAVLLVADLGVSFMGSIPSERR